MSSSSCLDLWDRILTSHIAKLIVQIAFLNGQLKQMWMWHSQLKLQQCEQARPRNLESSRGRCTQKHKASQRASLKAAEDAARKPKASQQESWKAADDAARRLKCQWSQAAKAAKEAEIAKKHKLKLTKFRAAAAKEAEIAKKIINKLKLEKLPWRLRHRKALDTHRKVASKFHPKLSCLVKMNLLNNKICGSPLLYAPHQPLSLLTAVGTSIHIIFYCEHYI